MTVAIPRVIGFVFVAIFCVGVALVSGHGPAPSASAAVQVKWGDGDCNGAVDPIDSLKTLKTDAGLAPAQTVAGCPAWGSNVTVNGITVKWGDGDCSGSVSPVDSLKVLKTDAGLPQTQTVPGCPDFGSTVTLGAGSSPTPTPTPTSGAWSASNFHWYEALPATTGGACDLTKPIPPGSPFIVGLCGTFQLQIPDANYTLRVVWKLDGTIVVDNSYPNFHLFAGTSSSSLTGVQQSGTYSLTEYANGVLLGTGQIVIAASTTPTPTPNPGNLVLVEHLPFLFLGSPGYNCNLIGSYLYCNASSFDSSNYTCNAIGSFFYCNASSFSWPNYSCNTIGSFVYCNASSFSWPNYSCSTIGSFIYCNSSSFDWADYNCSLIGTFVYCNSDSISFPSFNCTTVGSTFSCY